MEKGIRIFGISKEDIESVKVVGRAKKVRQPLCFLFIQ
nr:MAG TPA: hypothetical protein [Caudoviricetes sp.]